MEEGRAPTRRPSLLSRCANRARDVWTISDMPYQGAVVGRPYGAGPFGQTNPRGSRAEGVRFAGLLPSPVQDARSLQSPSSSCRAGAHSLLIPQGRCDSRAHPAGPAQFPRSFCTAGAIACSSCRAYAIPLLVSQGRYTWLSARAPHAGPSAQTAGGMSRRTGKSRSSRRALARFRS